jgi:hypothetical protein
MSNLPAERVVTPSADGVNVMGSAAAPFIIAMTFVGGVGMTAVPSLDAVGALALGANAATTSISIGQATVAPSFTGGLTVAANKAVTGSGAMAVEATGALTLGGNASTTSIAVGQATVAPNFVGGLTIASAKAITGLGNLAVESASGSTLTLGAASNAIALGQSGKVTTISGLVSIGGASDASALLNMVSTTTGLGLPSMTTTQRGNVAAPRAGLVIYNSTTNKINVFTTGWEAVTSA